MGKADISSSEKLEIEILASEETEAFTGKYYIFLITMLSFLTFLLIFLKSILTKKTIISSIFSFCFINRFQTKIQINFFDIFFYVYKPTVRQANK